MSEIIRTWLQTRLGLLFEDQTWEEDRGGGILASLLNSYALINDDQLKIIMSKQDDLYLATLEVMRLTIQYLGIHLDKEEFQNVLDAKGTSVTKLFYELYLALNNKDTADVLLAQKLMKPVKLSRFSVITHEDAYEVNEGIEIEKFNNPLALGLSAREEVVKYHVKKYLELMEKCKRSREEYMAFLENKRIADKGRFVDLPRTSTNVSTKTSFDINELPEDTESLNQSVSELVTETKKTKKLRCIVPDSKLAKKIISNIQNNSLKTSKNQAMRDTFRKQILNNLWDKLLAEQEDYFKNQFTEKLQQQSLYEQRMTLCLLNVREKRHDMAKEKSEMMAQIRDEQENHAINKLFDSEHKKDLKRYKYYADKDRKLKLHRKLFERKKEAMQAETKAECESIIKDILDISFYNIEYQADHCEPVPRRKKDDLARLFVERQPIFDVLSDVTEIITNEDDSSDDVIDPFMLTEFTRQNVLDDLTFEDYHSFKWPWDFNSWMEFPEYTDMTLGLNILGHIVYRLLQRKSRTKSVAVTTPVHRPDIAICIDGLHSLDFLPALEQLLRARKVKIIQITEAIEFCLAAFKEEFTQTMLDDIYDIAAENIVKETEQEIVKKKAPSKKDLKKGSKTQSIKGTEEKKRKKSNKSKQVSEFNLDQIKTQMVEDKDCQTPTLFPGEEPNISPAARVGKHLFEVINLGETPDEYLNASALAEYLQSFNYNEVLGWALVNYPQTIQQAVILEETLSGNKIPFEISNLPDQCDEVLIDVEPRPGFQYAGPAKLRTSKLFDKPKEVLEDLDCNTFLTAFIEMRTEDKNDPGELIYDCFKTVENKKALCKFYRDQGCKYTLYYKEMDFETVKHLGKLILGNTVMPPQDSETMFTDAVHYVEANFGDLITSGNTNVVKDEPEKDKKNRKSRKSQASTEVLSEKLHLKSAMLVKSKLDNISKKEKKNKSKKSLFESHNVDNKTEEGYMLASATEVEEIKEPPPPPALPGEDNWTYYDLPIQPYYEEILSTLWENIEDIYTTDMKQLFFRRRAIMDALIPYNTHVKNNMLRFIARPDIKQKYLTDFQLAYNAFEQDMREDDEVKAELHMRIEEFREKLWKFCDERMLENESERMRIIQENWVTTQLIELCNIYTMFIQLELDRSTDTSQMLVDYYSAMIINTPCTEPILNNYKLEIIVLPTTIEDLDHVAPFVEFTEDIMQHVEKFLKEEYQDQRSTTMFKPEKNPFVNKIRVNLGNARKNIDENLKNCERTISNLERKFNPKADKVKEKKGDKKEKKGKERTVSVVSEVFTQEPDNEVKQHSMDLLRELQTVIKGENLRCALRLNILEHAFQEELQDMLDKSIGGFATLYKFIDQKYQNEINAVEQAAKLLKRAVEEETPIQPEMRLENDKFYVKLGSLMYESPLPDDEIPIYEPINDDVFSIAQLSRIADVLYRLAPTGIIPSRAFTFLVQEFIVHRDDDGKGDFMPKLWKKLPPHKVQLVMNKIFGDTVYLDWKDFIIYCFGVPFPTERELLQIRSKFRALDPDMTEFIHDFQYPQIKFWFEDEVHSQRLQHLRDFLFRLYSCDKRLNYPALLLGFCKDTEPILGFAKALVVSLGKMIIIDEERGSTHYAHGLKKIMATEISSIVTHKERVDNTTCISEEVIEKLIDETIHCSNSIVKTALDDNAAPLCTHDVMEYLNQSQMQAPFETDEEKLVQCSEYDITSVSDDAEYHVSFDTVINIFTVMLPWLHKIKLFGELTFHERFAMLYNSLINEDVRVAYIYQIANHPDFLKMFEKFYKFYDCRVSDIVRTIVENDT